MDQKDIKKRMLLHFSEKLRLMSEDDELLSDSDLSFDESRPLKFVPGETGDSKGSFVPTGKYSLIIKISEREKEEEECPQN
jgi:hypothetical protein